MIYCPYLVPSIPHELSVQEGDAHQLQHQMATRILGNIYLSSFDPIKNDIDLKSEYGITHIVSVVTGDLPDNILQDYSHLQIDITDEPTSDLLGHLETAIAFIDDALSVKLNDVEDSKTSTGSVLVHCAQGESRSVAVIVAYLMYKHKLSYKQALYAVKRKAANVEPNTGFVKQLQLFGEMGCKVDTSNPLYREYFVENSLILDPTGASLLQSGYWKVKKQNQGTDDDVTAQDNIHGERSDVRGAKEGATYNLRCKRCRTVLGTNNDVETHEIPDSESRQAHFVRTVPNSRRIISSIDAAKTCSHYFMSEPMSWMETELNRQELEGKFSCPKCEAKVGGYSWKGSRCSCGKWMVPAIHLQSAKIDLMKA